jgi:cell division protein ZapA
MSNVTLHIGGRDYTVACAEGEEAHLVGLGQTIEGKLLSLAGNAGMSEGRQLLFAALLLADELHESGGNGAAPAASAPARESAPAPAFDPAQLEALADRLESCAASLEG